MKARMLLLPIILSSCSPLPDPIALDVQHALEHYYLFNFRPQEEPGFSLVNVVVRCPIITYFSWYRGNESGNARFQFSRLDQNIDERAKTLEVPLKRRGIAWEIPGGRVPDLKSMPCTAINIDTLKPAPGWSSDEHNV